MRESALRKIGAGAIHAGGFYRAGGKTSNSLPRKNAWPAILRPFGERDHAHARGGVPGRRSEDIFERQRFATCNGRTSSWCATMLTNSARRRWWWRLAGLSIPKMGATSFGYDLARQFGLKIQKPRPALVPLVFGAADREQYCDLAGVSAEVVAALGEQRFRESMLITHRGLSGPAILQISSYWNKGRAGARLIWRRDVM